MESMVLGLIITGIDHCLYINIANNIIDGCV